jgi:hypothetical protein
MKTILLTILLIVSLSSAAQIDNNIPDSAIIILKNVSTVKFTKVLASINGKFIGGLNLNPGDSTVCKVPITGKQEGGRFAIYLDEKFENAYNIQPMDYPFQVTNEILEKATYLFSMNIAESEGGWADIKVKKIK